MAMETSFPFYTEPEHLQGLVTPEAGNAARTTLESAEEGRLIVEASDKIMLLEPNKHPLVSLMTSVGKVYDGKAWKGNGILKAATGNPEFSWFEDFYNGRYCTVAGALKDDDVIITVDGAGTNSAYLFTVGDVVKNSLTDENMLVVEITSGSSITVERAFGSTAAAAIDDDSGLFIVGNVNEENSGARNVNTTRAAKESNYTQIFKTSITVSGTEREANLYGGPDLPYLRAKHGTQHALDIERAFWWGEMKTSYSVGTQGHPRRTTGGILEWIKASGAPIFDATGGLTVAEFNVFLREAFTYGSDSKYLFTGGILLNTLNEVARGQIQMRPLEKSYGMSIGTWTTPFGTINIIHNPLFVQAYAGTAFVIDMDCLKYRYMNNRDTKLFTNVQGNDVDGQIDQYVSEVGLQRMQGQKCAYIYGITD